MMAASVSLFRDAAMPLRLPPLSSLRFFEAAGRLLSFKRAAEELNVTPSAVSHGIMGLEQALGVTLFVREPRRLSLTPEGADYLTYVSEALTLIAIGTQRLPSRYEARSIAISCAPTIASRWLLPRLPGFQERWAGVSVDVQTSHRQVGFPVDGFDFAIRMSRASAAAHGWSRLFSERLVPLCAPAYRERFAGPDGFVDLERARLIHLTAASEDWAAWFDATGLAMPDAPPALRCDTIQFACEAAVAGLGVVLGRRPLVDADLEAGLLVEAHPRTVAAETAYWLVSSAAVEHRPDLRAFKRWVLEEAAAFSEAVG